MKARVQEIVPELQREWIHARAAGLARAGQLRQARRLLENGLECLRPARPEPLLDLLARVCAQSGAYDEARRLWREAQRIHPDSEEYAAALERVEFALAQPPEGEAGGDSPRRRAGGDSRTLVLLYATLFVCLALLATVLWMVLNHRAGEPPASSPRTSHSDEPDAQNRRARGADSR